MDFGSNSLEILLVQNDPEQVRLIRDALGDSGNRHTLHDVGNGETALTFLRREGAHAASPRPDLVLLDLDGAAVDGCGLLKTVKGDPALRSIPVVVIASSAADAEVLRSYNLHANCYVTKPDSPEQHRQVVRALEEFWCGTIKLPPRQ